MNMKKVIVALVFMSVAMFGFSQNYKTGIGLRGGVIQGITFKQFVGGSSAFDFIVGTHHRGFNFTVLYQKHVFNVFDVPNLSLFYGFGGHVGFYNHTYINHWGTYKDDVMAIGPDMVVGVEYTFDEIPINVGLDIKPALNIIPNIRYWQGGALYLRYVF